MQIKLSNVSTVKRGGSPRPITDFLCDNGLPWLKISDFVFGQRAVNKSHEFIKPEGLNKTKLVKSGTLIVTNSASPGIPIFLGKDMCLHDGFLYFESIDPNVNKMYLYYFLIKQRDYLKSQGNGSIFINLKKEILENLEIDLPSLETQKHIVNTIGSVDNLIENKQKQIDKICCLLDKSLSKYSDTVDFEYYDIQIIKSGINKFNESKQYIDTSCVEGINNILGYEEITLDKRPSRANMQPIINSVWFAKMKGSNKVLLLTKHDKDIINSTILSTGFQGILATDKLPLSLLSAFVISNNFKVQRDINSVGTTMAGINNETLLKIKVPYLSSEDIKEFDKKYSTLIDNLSLLRQEINKLSNIKQSLLNKYF